MSAYRRSRYGSKRRRTDSDQHQGKKIVIRIMLFALAIITACVLRLSNAESIQSIRQKAQDVINGTTDYKEAVETLGRAASGEKTEDGGNPIAVFGRMLLGLSEDTP